MGTIGRIIRSHRIDNNIKVINMNNADTQYLTVARELRDTAVNTPNRTDTSAYKKFGTQLSFDLRDGFPLLTTKKVFLRGIIHELLWFLNGDTNIKYLQDNKCKIWDEWATADGELGPVYGAQWRRWEDIKIPKSEAEYNALKDVLGYQEIGTFNSTNGSVSGAPVLYREIDQIADAINTLKTNPEDRRIIITAYNPAVKPTIELKPHENAEINLQALPPCHMIFQFNTTPIGYEEREQLFLEQQNTKLTNDPDWVTHGANEGHADDTLEDIATRQNMELLSELAKTENVPFDEVLTAEFNIPTHHLDLQMYQRSADWFLGVPFNIASYSLLLMMFAQQTNTIARNYIHTFGDYHIYENHLDQIDTQLNQEQYDLPTMTITKAESIDSYTVDDFVLTNYQHGPVLKGDVAV